MRRGKSTSSGAGSRVAIPQLKAKQRVYHFSLSDQNLREMARCSKKQACGFHYAGKTSLLTAKLDVQSHQLFANLGKACHAEILALE